MVIRKFLGLCELFFLIDLQCSEMDFALNLTFFRFLFFQIWLNIDFVLNICNELSEFRIFFISGGLCLPNIKLTEISSILTVGDLGVMMDSNANFESEIDGSLKRNLNLQVSL